MSSRRLPVTCPLPWAGLLLLLVLHLSACAVSSDPVAVNPGGEEAPAAGPVASPEPGGADTAPAVEAQPLTRDMVFDVLLAEIAGQRGRLDVSVPHYLQAALESRDPRVAERAIQIASFAKDYPAALRAARHWVSLDSENLDARKLVAALALQTGDTSDVVDQLDYIVTHSENEQQGFAVATAILSRHGEAETAIAVMQELATRHPASADAQLALGRLAALKGRLELASMAADAALALQPGMPRAQILKAQILIRLERKDEALALLGQAVKDSPEHADLRFAYGRLLLDADDLEGAREEFRAAVRLAPGNSDALFSLALLELETGQLESAETHLLEMLETGEKQQSVYYYLGFAAQQLGKDDDAVKWYGKVTAGEYWTQSQLRMAKILIDQGRLDQVREKMQHLRRNDPENAVQIYLIEGQILSDLALHNEAWHLYDQALAIHTDNEDLLYSRALSAEKIDRLDLSERDMRRILELDPDNVRALNALGYTLADRTDRYEEALGYIERAYAIKPEDPAIIDSMGWVHYRLGKLQEARGYLQDAWEMTRDGEIGAHLGEVLWMQGEHDAARGIWSEAQDSDPDNPVLKKTLERLTQ